MNTNWTIRLTNQTDVQAVTSVLLVSWLDTYVNDSIGIDRQFIFESQIHYITYNFYSNDCKFEYFRNTKDNLHLVAFDKNEIVVGFLHCRREKGKQYFSGIYLLPEFKGTGLAQEFAKMFIDWEDRTLDTEVGVVEYNERAIRFYKKLGFEPNGVKYNIRDMIPCIDLVKKNVTEKTK